MIKIRFYYADRNFIFIKNKTALKAFVSEIFKKELTDATCANVDYIFCSDEYLLNINRKFLNHDFYTDIITFDLSENTYNISAEIYISKDRVQENAQINNVPVYQEMRRVIFHGALHLCGYNDKTKAEVKIMRTRENFYLGMYESGFT